jgi:hypothetical protein
MRPLHHHVYPGTPLWSSCLSRETGDDTPIPCSPPPSRSRPPRSHPLSPTLSHSLSPGTRTWMTQRRGITSSLSASSSSRSQTTCRMATHSVALRTQASPLRSVKGASQPSEARTSRAHGRKCVKQAGVWWQDGAGQRLVRSRASLSSVDTARLRDGALGAICALCRPSVLLSCSPASRRRQAYRPMETPTRFRCRCTLHSGLRAPGLEDVGRCTRTCGTWPLGACVEYAEMCG